MEPNTASAYDVCVIGGAGHVGLPLSVAFARKGIRTAIVDINERHCDAIRAGTFPFMELNGDEALAEALAKGTLSVHGTPDAISESAIVVIVIGTPIDEYLNPDFHGLVKLVEHHLPYFRDGQILLLRSTVFPGTTEMIQKFLHDRGKRVTVAFCPERIVQGKALEELAKLPQIISACDECVLDKVEALFRAITDKKIIRLPPKEAELSKLFSNAWRYIAFSAANQFYMIAKNHGLDYDRIYRAMGEDYPRNDGLPRAGFAAGPCLFKDTMQLSAFANNQFLLGHAAMLINEGLPGYILKQTKAAVPEELHRLTLGILGMAFKRNNDDKRDSLSYKLRKLAETEFNRVLCHDPYIADPTFSSLDDLITGADVIIVATPHDEYARIDPAQYPGKRFIDIWDVLASESIIPAL
jgi:UDP-N-acetyl-D-mannosaminuronic acid dehydrogenase